MFEDDFIPCWKLDLLPERIARRYMKIHIRLRSKTLKSKTAKVNLSDRQKQYSLDLAA